MRSLSSFVYRYSWSLIPVSIIVLIVWAIGNKVSELRQAAARTQLV